MFKKLSEHLRVKYGQANGLGRQLQIVKAFDVYKEEIKKVLVLEPDIKPVSLKNKVLTVLVKSSVVANELRFLERQALEKINAVLKKEAVKKIKYRF